MKVSKNTKLKSQSLVYYMVTVVLILAIPACATLGKKVDLSPASWGEEEIQKYTELNQLKFSQPKLTHSARGRKGMVASTTGALAVRAGIEALKQGGSAADAAMVTSLAQIILTAGAIMSYAGVMSMMYYDTASEEVYSMNAVYNIPQIPPLSSPSRGRWVLVPGFMAGVQAAHDRFGKLPFEALFEPAIYFAEKGFRLEFAHGWAIERNKEVLNRLPETKSIFTKENGEFYQQGDHFRQPKVAETLRRVAAEGADYIYRGPWAQMFVQVVQRDGGKITLEDMAAYQVIWPEPLRTTYRDYEVFGPGLPGWGGVNTIEAFNLLEAADLKRYGHHSTSPEGLFWLMQITRAHVLSSGPPGILITPEKEVTLESRMTKETAGFIWEKMQRGEFPYSRKPRARTSDHSTAVVAVDGWGNVAAVVHSNNAGIWGETGIFIDGISIPDPGRINPIRIGYAGPGNRLPEPLNPTIVLHKGKPIVASGSIGSGEGLHQITMQSLVNILDYGMDAKTALDTPSFFLPHSLYSPAQVWKGDFTKDVLKGVRAMGQPVEELPLEGPREGRGWWVGIVIDPKTGNLMGGAPGDITGYAVGY